jgi:methionyl-tRNA formyltransferase
MARIALFGQAAFGRDVLLEVLKAGHEVVAVYAPPEGGRPDPLAEAAQANGVRLLRPARFRAGGTAIPERVAEHRSLGAELNVLAYVTVILPPEIVDVPRLRSLCFHPSLLPRFRGGSAIPWQIALGERETGVTVFQPDAGVDTGPIVLQRGEVAIEATDTAATLYFQKLYPLGVRAMADAVDGVASGRLRPVAQDESRATHQGLMTDEAARLDFARPAEELDRWIRACDPQPGAHALLGDTRVRLFDGRLVAARDPGAPPGTILELAEGALRIAAEGGVLAVGRVRVGDGAKVAAADSGLAPGERLR